MITFALRKTVRASLSAAAPPRLARTLSATVSGPQDELVPSFLSPAGFSDILSANGVDFYAGVPDSLLKDFCGYVADHHPAKKHVITANEGSAVAMGAGYHMATGKVPLVYLQNSGLGNVVNPILSLASPEVYGIPMILLVGWRGEPGRKDEPQHRTQGKLMPGMLAAMDVPFEIVPDYEDGAKEVVESALAQARSRSTPFALVVRKNTFSKYTFQREASDYQMTREEAIKCVLVAAGEYDPVVSTTGFSSREVFELREEMGQDHSRDFLTVGSMGHASAIAAGIAIAKPSRNVVCIDGDGALAMHLGNALTVGLQGLPNYVHVLINNGLHDSVGGQPTGMFGVDFEAISKGMGYTHYALAETPEEIQAAFAACQSNRTGASMLEIRTKGGARSGLGRPTTTPVENKDAYMEFLRE